MRITISPPLPDISGTRPKRGAVVVTGVKGYHQMDNYSCGAAVVATLHASVTGTVCFDAWHVIAREAFPSREHGTPTASVLRALRRLKFKASRLPTYLSPRNLAPALTAGDLVLTSIKMPRQPPGDTHWVVIAGCSERDGILALNCTGAPLFSK